MGVKESVFFSSIVIMIIFEVGYYFIYPETAFALGLGALTSIVIVGVTTGLVAGLNIVSSGENTFGTRVAFVASTLICIFFRLEIPISSFNEGNILAQVGMLHPIDNIATPYIPLGIGLLHPNLTSVFLVENMGLLGIFGMLIVTIIVFLTIVSGLMIMAGDSD